MALGIGLHRRRASGFYMPPAGNVIPNWKGAGTGGTSGLPDGWVATSAATLLPTNGLSLSVNSVTSYKGGSIIDFSISGTAVAAGDARIIFGGTAGAQAPYAAAAGETWRWSIFAEPVGVQSHVLSGQLMWRTGANGFISFLGAQSLASATITGGPTVSAPITAPATTGLVGFVLTANYSAGQAVSLRYKIFAPTLTRIS